MRAANLATGAEEAAGTYFARHSPGGKPGDNPVGAVWHKQEKATHTVLEQAALFSEAWATGI